MLSAEAPQNNPADAIRTASRRLKPVCVLYFIMCTPLEMVNQG